MPHSGDSEESDKPWTVEQRALVAAIDQRIERLLTSSLVPENFKEALLSSLPVRVEAEGFAAINSEELNQK